jgi:FlaA1/EpsC-like NDP-sugar epimerase
MGDPVRIVHLVETYAAQAGVAGLEVQFTGLRPGEKLNETLFSESEQRVATAHPRIAATFGEPVAADFDDQLARLFRTAADNRVDDVRELLAELVPDYKPPAEPVGALSGLFDSFYPDDF